MVMSECSMSGRYLLPTFKKTPLSAQLRLCMALKQLRREIGIVKVKSQHPILHVRAGAREQEARASLSGQDR